MEKLIQLLEEFGIEKEEINQNTRLYHDLGIYGDDADEFLEQYTRMFNVKVINFKFSDYFPSEGNLISSLIVRLIFFKSQKKFKELTIGDLIDGIKKGTIIF